MKNLKKLAKEHPVAVYYLTALLISWGGLVIFLGGTDMITSGKSNAPFLPLYFITVAGPSIAGVILTGFYDGIQGYRELFSRLKIWRVKTKWYAAALLFAPLTVLTSLFALSIFSSVYIPGIFSSSDNPTAIVFGLPGDNKMLLILFVLMLSLFNGFIEELGWTGFAAHRLKLNHHLIATGFSLGMLWGLWHFLSNYMGSAEGAGDIPLPIFMIVVLFSFLPPFRILMLWVYARTQSLFIAVLMHASLDFFWLLSMPVAISGQQRVTWYVGWAAVIWIIVAIVSKIESQKRIIAIGNNS